MLRTISVYNKSEKVISILNMQVMFWSIIANAITKLGIDLKAKIMLSSISTCDVLK